MSRIAASTPRIVVMGVSGCGKSTIGQALASALSARYIEGDDLHPPANVAAMAAGQPLTDEMRVPWLNQIREEMEGHVRDGHTVVASCSALRRTYRERLAQTAPVFFIHLSLSPEVARGRMAQRNDHFMPPSLSRSQAKTLEALENDEFGATLDADGEVTHLLEEVLACLRNGVLFGFVANFRVGSH